MQNNPVFVQLARYPENPKNLEVLKVYMKVCLTYKLPIEIWNSLTRPTKEQQLVDQ